ncbi:MAG: triose-phosphate isomerase [Bdellovibrionota bacterium]
MIEKVVAANWKMYKNPEESTAFLKKFLELLPPANQKQVFIFPQTVCLQAVEDCLAEQNVDILTGAQNCYTEDEGAFTGEISPKVLKDMKTDAILIGHSERRSHFKEDNELLSKKIKSAQAHNLIPMYCIGETLDQRKGGKTFDVLKEQLEVGLKHFDRKGSLIVAYEPVWAIGTGEVATPEQAQEAHAFVRKTLQKITGLDTYKILYGGSVKPENAQELISKPDIDGFLVGGASLKPDSLAQICQIALTKRR